MILRHRAGFTVAVLSFFVFSFAIGAESAQTKKSAKPAPTPAKKTAKAAPTPSKKVQAKAAPTPKKSTDKNAKNKSADKNSKSSKDSAKSKTASAKDKKADSKKQTADKTKSKSLDKKTAVSKTKTDSKATTKNNKSETKSKSSTAKTTVKKDAPKPAIVKTVASRETTNLANSETKTSTAPQVVVTDISARVRSQAKPTATELGYIKLGTILDVTEKTPAWYRVRFTNGTKTATGWISAKSVNDLKSGGKNQIYRQLAERHYKPSGMDFATASEVYEFLGYAAETETSEADDAMLELKKLLALRSAVKAIPSGKANDNPYQAFLKANEKSLVYSDPAGSWMVGSNLFWDLHKKYAKSPLAEQIAWEGAQNPLPGECEGYVNCYLFFARMTSGEYLSRHPSGKHNLQALTDLTNYLQPIAENAENKLGYNGPTDVTDRAEFNNLLAELRTIVSRVPLTEKEKPLRYLRKIAEDFR